MEPGLAILFHPMKELADMPYSSIAKIPISVPVRPRPALQWTAIAPEPGLLKWVLQQARKSSIICYGGTEPSTKIKSSCSIPLSKKACAE